MENELFAEIFHTLVEKTYSILKSKDIIILNDHKLPEIIHTNRISMKSITAFIEISGDCNIMVLLSLDKKICEQIMKKCFYVDNSMEKNNYLMDTAKELLNIIIGNSLNTLREKNINIRTNIPETFLTIDLPVCEDEDNLLYTEINTISGSMLMSLISMECAA